MASGSLVYGGDTPQWRSDFPARSWRSLQTRQTG
jgi:hypothetical protein